MNKRSLLATILMVATPLGLLWFLKMEEKIDYAGIAIIILIGAVFIGLSHFLYRKLWSDDDED